LGRVLGASQLGHASAEAAFKCYLFRKSSMSQRLILRGLHSAMLTHTEKAEAPDMYKASFAKSAKGQQVNNTSFSMHSIFVLLTWNRAAQIQSFLIAQPRMNAKF